jgi:hypothetical protein
MQAVSSFAHGATMQAVSSFAHDVTMQAVSSFAHGATIQAVIYFAHGATMQAVSSLAHGATMQVVSSFAHGATMQAASSFSHGALKNTGSVSCVYYLCPHACVLSTISALFGKRRLHQEVNLSKNICCIRFDLTELAVCKYGIHVCCNFRALNVWDISGICII